MKMCCAWLTNSGAKGSPKISGSIEPWWLRHKSGSSCSGKKRVQIQGMYIDYGTTKNHIALFWIFLFSSQLIVKDITTYSLWRNGRNGRNRMTFCSPEILETLIELYWSILLSTNHKCLLEVLDCEIDSLKA